MKGLSSLAVLLAFLACNTSDKPQASGTKAPIVVADASPPDTVLKSKPAAPKKPTFGNGAISPAKQASFDDLEKLPAEVLASENDFLGSSACQGCHQDKYSIWQASTHGRAGGKPSKDLVIPSFDNVELVFKDAVVRLTDKKGDYAFHVTENGQPKRRFDVVGVVGSGRIYGGATQTYFTEMKDGRQVMLPFDYSVTNKKWFCQTGADWRFIDKSMSLRDCQYPPSTHLGHSSSTNCQDCHGSQITTKFSNREKKHVTRYTELSINCESCHGPGSKHVGLMKRGAKGSDIGYEPLDLLTRDRSIGVCGRCHMDKSMIAPGYVMGQPEDDFFTTLFMRDPRNGELDIDGMVLRFSYQESHVYSSCYRDGSMTCVDCHDPHSLHYRDIWGKSIDNRFSDQQCVDCHPSKIGAEHDKHPGREIECVQCHMPMRQHPAVGETVTYKRSDHAVSIPRLRGLRSDVKFHGCGHCHVDKSRDWLIDAQKRLYGDSKPEAGGATELNAAEVKLAAANDLIGIRRTGALKYALQAFDKVEANHPAYIVRTLSAVVAASVESNSGKLSKDARMKLTAWLYHSNLDVRGAAAATAFYLSAYEPDLIDVGLKAIIAAAPSKQRALRRRVVFNLLSIMFMVVPRSVGAGQLARRAVEDYAMKLAESPNPAATLLGTAHRSSNRPGQAVDWYRKALRDVAFQKAEYPVSQAGTQSKILYSLGQVLSDEGQSGLAQRAYRDAVTFEPYNVQYRESLCLVYLKGGNASEALGCVTELMELSPGFVQGYFIRARLLEQLGRLPEALAVAEKGLEFDPSNKIARSNIERLRRAVRGQ